jgi:hypothetical protein
LWHNSFPISRILVCWRIDELLWLIAFQFFCQGYFRHLHDVYRVGGFTTNSKPIVKILLHSVIAYQLNVLDCDIIPFPFLVSLFVDGLTNCWLHFSFLLGVFSSLTWCMSSGWLHHQLETNSNSGLTTYNHRQYYFFLIAVEQRPGRRAALPLAVGSRWS